jgi:hypothetical protein
MHEAFTLAFVDYRFTGAFSFRRSRQIEVPKHTNPDNGQSTQATY